MDSIPQKRCTTCGEYFPANTEYFNKQSRGLYGISSKCKKCTKEYDARPERKANRRANDRTEAAKERARKRRRTPEYKAREEARRASKNAKSNLARKSPEQVEKRRRYQSLPKNRERANNYSRRRRADFSYVFSERKRDSLRRQKPGYKLYNRTKSHNRRAREALAGGRHTAKDIELQLRSQKGMCWWCGEPLGDDYHIDHRIPLDKGGSNDARNIVLTHEKCNLSKGAKLPWEYNGRLL